MAAPHKARARPSRRNGSQRPVARSDSPNGLRAGKVHERRALLSDSACLTYLALDIVCKESGTTDPQEGSKR